MKIQPRSEIVLAAAQAGAFSIYPVDSDACYYGRRAEEEFAAARAAVCDRARAAHFEMGERYAQRAAAIVAVNEQLGPWTWAER